MEVATCTDIKQTWGKLKSEAKSMYQTVPLDEMCHGLEKPPVYKSPPVTENLKTQALQAMSQSRSQFSLNDAFQARRDPVVKC